jgi:thiol-disulfide isomerase/thioredoxin
MPNSQLLIPFIAFAITTLILTIIYLPIKQLIKTNSKNKQELASFKKWKTDASLFIAQWEKEPTCDNTIWENDLLIGNADAPIRITVACNPYCGPCAREHEKLDKLVEKYSDKLSVQVRLFCKPNDATNKLTIATKAILHQAQMVKNNAEMKAMLTDWFEWMNYEKWSEKYKTPSFYVPLNSISAADTDIVNIITKHQKWFSDTNISATPTLFINGRKQSGRYNLKNIEKMIPQLAHALVGLK